MNLSKIIIGQKISNKSYGYLKNKTILLKVALKANKNEIRNAFEFFFHPAEVCYIRTVIYKPKKKRIGRTIGKTSFTKIAFVKVKDTKKIPFLFKEKKN